MRALQIDVWSDIACPWCYVGKRRLEAALARFPYRDAAEVKWRAFELDPAAPAARGTTVSQAQRLADEYGMSVKQAEARMAQLMELAAADGLDLRLDHVQSGNTFDGHRVVHLGAERGRQDAVKERLLRAYMTEGQLISDHDVLARLGAEAGLEPVEIRAVLASDRYAREVRADEEQASALGIRGVPFFVLGGRYALSGAQPSDVILHALNQAWEEVVGKKVHLEGATCGPDGC